MRFVLVLASMAAGVAALCCAWDNDTLAQETEGLPEILDVIAGRFNVNPDSYYEARIRIMDAKSAKGTLVLNDYDNAAMAHDRLGNAKEALAWIQRKEKRLQKEQPDIKGDDWYRFFANRGTIYAHDWARRKDGKNVKLLDLGIADLVKAVDINPNAHFGRERVQIQVLLQVKSAALTGEMDERLWGGLLNHDENLARRGIIGMMSLGTGWDSPDLHYLLAATYGSHELARENALTLRTEQLIASGKTSMFSDYDPNRYPKVSRADAMNPEDVAMVAQLVANGNEYRQNRADYIERMLRLGEHPDTHPEFWALYTETPRLEFETPERKPRSTKRNNIPLYAAGVGLTIGVVGVFAWLLVRRRGA